MICDKNKCTGCFACYNICPKDCINMKEDEFGNIYPEIDMEKCINCGMCKNVCPQLNQVKFSEPQKAYAMYNVNEKLREESTSGGAATTFYMHVLNKGGVVYGCNNLENNEISFIRVSDINDLKKLKGSKYVHAYINNVFNLIKKDLKDNKLVLFIGTPCQVAGLKSFLKSDYENLILVDIVCHGVPSQKLLKDEIDSCGVQNVKKISFRGKDGFKFKIYQDNEVLMEEIYENAYYKGFMNAVFYRPNCYECIYATPKRVSDMTIGDFWGLSNEAKLYDKEEKGVSVLLPITQKGLDLIKECKKDIILEERPVLEAINGNTQLRRPSAKGKKYEKFKKIYLTHGYEKACKTFMRGSKLKGRIKNKLKSNQVIYKVYKMIKEKI